MKDAVALLVVWVALIYLYRLISLKPKVHQITFGISHVVGAAACVYSAASLSLQGWGMLEVLTPIMAALYLFRSRETYRIATMPTPLDDPLSRLFH